MTADDTASILFLSLLGLLIGGSYLVANRHRLGQVAQQAAIWFFIFVGAVVVIGNWDRVSQAALPVQTYVDGAAGTVVDVPRRRDGHYYLRLEVNGTPVDFVVDTGATDLVLAREDARRAGVDTDALTYAGTALTANGSVGTARVRLDTVALGAQVDRGVGAVVTDGDLQISLLGMSYLQTFGRIEIADGRLRLIR